MNATAAQRPLVGTIVFVASATMMFAALLFAYALLREQGELGPWRALPALKPVLASVFVVLSAVLARRWLAAAALCALAFVATQLAWWFELSSSGIWLTDSPRSSFVYALSSFHALHVLVGLIAFAVLLLRKRGPGKGWLLYWDFVAVVWFAIAFTLFAIR